MKKIFKIVAFLIPFTSLVSQNKGTFSFAVKDAETGYGIQSEIKLEGANGEKTTMADNGGHFIFTNEIGNYDLTIFSNNYNTLNTYFSIIKNDTVFIEVLLDKKNKPIVKYKALDYAYIQGYVVDKSTGRPLKDVTVFFDDKIKSLTNDAGYYSIITNEFSKMETRTEKPVRKNIKFLKQGYSSYNLNDVFIAPTTITINAEISIGNTTTSIKQTQHILDGTKEDTKQYELTKTYQENNLNKIVSKQVTTCATPTSIRVGTGCSCISCNNVTVMSLQYYSESGIDDEWIPSWPFESLAAGSVPYRSYAGWCTNNPVDLNYDIANTTCNQVWGPTLYANTQAAAQSTSITILTSNGSNPARSEYSAENNNGGDLFNCSDCNAGGSGIYACYYDNICCSTTPAGHGRGMCQWGSRDWAVAGRNHTWIIDHYFIQPAGYSLCPQTAPTPTTSLDVTAPVSVASITNPANYKTANFAVSFADADNISGSGLDKSFYSVLDWNGTEWRANNTKGFLCDNFDNTLHAEWTATSGTWNIGSNILNQTDNVNTNTALNINLNQSLSNRYIYHWLGKITGTGLNRSAGIHIMCDAVNSSNRGNSYLVLFKAVTNEVQIYKTISNVLGTAIITFTNVSVNLNTWYDNKVMYDRTTGKFTIWMNDDLIGTYTDAASPLFTGSGFSFKTSGCNYSINNLKVYKSRLVNTATVTIGNATSDVRYQSPNFNNTDFSCKIKTLCVDLASNISTVNEVNALIDWTPPSTPTTLNDGLTNDISSTTSLNTLSANFLACTDINSDINKYCYFIGTAVNDSSLLGATNNGLNTSITHTSLNLSVGTTYYTSVYALNNAGLKSIVASSNGQTVINTTNINETNTELINFNVYPNPNNGLFTISCNYTNELEFQITNALGELIDKQKITSAVTNYKNKLASGIYFITIINKNTIYEVKKIIVY